MKKQILLSVITLLAFFSVSNAQIKQISRDTFSAAYGNADELMSERSRRLITKTENFENGEIIRSTTQTQEITFPERKIRFLTVESKGGDVNTREWIRIGSKIYERENNGQWTARGLLTGDGSGGAFLDSSSKQYTEESTVVDGVSARKLTKLTVSESGKGLTFENFIIWYDSQGLFLRSERVKGLLEPRIEEFREVVTYEFDPKDLKIEAPIK